METEAIIQLVSVIAAIIAGVVWLKSALVKQRHEELETLANTRGERVDDLEKQVKSLQADVNNLRGQMQAIQALKVTEIASEVVAQLSPILGALKPQG